MLKLTRYFSITSGVLIAAVTLFAAFLLHRHDVASLISATERQNVAVGQAFSNSVWPDYEDTLKMAKDLSGDQIRALPQTITLNEDLRRLSQHLPVLKVKIYLPGGRTVFSSDFKQIGEDKSRSEAFQRTLKTGLPTSKLTRRDTFNAFEGTVAGVDIVESYIAIRSPGNKVEAIFELYSDVSKEAAQIDTQSLSIILSIFLGGIGLYVILFLIVDRADKTIKRQYQNIIDQDNALEARNRVLENSNREWQRFAYICSHDLQEPVRTIVSYMELLKKRLGDGLDEKSKRYMEFSTQASLRMRDLIQALFDYSQLDRKGKEVVKVDLNATLSDVLRDLRPLIKESGAKIEIDPLPPVIGDAAQLSRLFQNLIGNAIKYCVKDVDPEIQITVERINDNWTFAVADNGIGFADENKDRIFEMFQRLHLHDEYSGTGIGLSICRKVVEHHGGRIWAKSSPGKGSVFYFTLPAMREPLI